MQSRKFHGLYQDEELTDVIDAMPSSAKIVTTVVEVSALTVQKNWMKKTVRSMGLVKVVGFRTKSLTSIFEGFS